MNDLNSFIARIKNNLGIDTPIYGGRSAEVLDRIAKLMNREVFTESPCEEYARLAKLSFPSGRGERQTAD